MAVDGYFVILLKHLMETIVFFGRGGIGKSASSSNITVLLSAGGRKVPNKLVLAPPQPHKRGL